MHKTKYSDWQGMVVLIQYNIVLIEYNVVLIQYNIVLYQYNVVLIQYNIVLIQYHVVLIQYNVVHVFKVSQQCHWGFFSSGIWLFIMGSWPFSRSVLCNSIMPTLPWLALYISSHPWTSVTLPIYCPLLVLTFFLELWIFESGSMTFVWNVGSQLPSNAVSFPREWSSEIVLDKGGRKGRKKERKEYWSTRP